MVVPTKWRNGYLRQLLICRCHSSFQRLWPNKDKGAHWSSMLLQCDVKHFMRSKYFHDLPRTQEVVPRNKPSTTRHKPHLHGFHLSFLGLKTFNKNQLKLFIPSFSHLVQAKTRSPLGALSIWLGRTTSVRNENPTTPTPWWCWFHWKAGGCKEEMIWNYQQLMSCVSFQNAHES